MNSSELNNKVPSDINIINPAIEKIKSAFSKFIGNILTLAESTAIGDVRLIRFKRLLEKQIYDSRIKYASEFILKKSQDELDMILFQMVDRLEIISGASFENQFQVEKFGKAIRMYFEPFLMELKAINV